jgi:hypothetical protein
VSRHAECARCGLTCELPATIRGSFYCSADCFCQALEANEASDPGGATIAIYDDDPRSDGA